MFASIIVLNCINERKRVKEDVTKCHKAIHHFRFASKNVNRANNSHCFHPVWLHDLHYNAIIIIEEFLRICYHDRNFNDDDNNNNNNISARERSLRIRYESYLMILICCAFGAMFSKSIWHKIVRILTFCYGRRLCYNDGISWFLTIYVRLVKWPYGVTILYDTILFRDR